MNETPSTTQPNGKLLIVDDNHVFGEALVEIIGIALPSVSITYCRSVPEAVQSTQDTRYDVILCDYCIGKQTAMDLFENASFAPDTKPAFLVMSSYSTADSEQLCKTVGIQAFIDKTMGLKSFVQQLRKYLPSPGE